MSEDAAHPAGVHGGGLDLPGSLTGVVVAGGRGTRMEGAKATALLGGRPLISYPLGALQRICERVVVVCKADTELPQLAVPRWNEPDEPRHPVAGIGYALERAGGPILVCAADMPFVTPDVLALIAAELQPGVKAAAAVADGRLEPLLAAYTHQALASLGGAAANEPLRRTVEALIPVLVEVPAAAAFNVNTRADLDAAAERLTSG